MSGAGTDKHNCVIWIKRNSPRYTTLFQREKRGKIQVRPHCQDGIEEADTRNTISET